MFTLCIICTSLDVQGSKVNSPDEKDVLEQMFCFCFFFIKKNSNLRLLLLEIHSPKQPLCIPDLAL